MDVVTEMRKLELCKEQGTDDWLAIREGMFTASDISAILGMGGGNYNSVVSRNWVTWFITAKSAGKLPAGTKNVAVKYILPWLVMGWGIIYSGLAIVKLIEKDSDAIKDINITMIVVSLVMSILVGLFLWWLVKKGGLTSSSATAGIDISVDDLMTL